MDTNSSYPVSLSYEVLAFIKDGSFDELLKLIEHDLVDQWRSSPAANTLERERLYHDTQALYRLKSKIVGMVDVVKIDQRS